MSLAVVQPDPFDPLKMQKGDYLSPYRLESLIGARRGTKEYQLALMAFKGRCERELRRAGRPMTVKYEREGLRFLTDEEAVHYNLDRANSAFRSVFRSYQRNLEVDRSNLTADDQRVLDRGNEFLGRSLQAMRSIRRRIRLQPYEPATPRTPKG